MMVEVSWKDLEPVVTKFLQPHIYDLDTPDGALQKLRQLNVFQPSIFLEYPDNIVQVWKKLRKQLPHSPDNVPTQLGESSDAQPSEAPNEHEASDIPGQDKPLKEVIPLFRKMESVTPIVIFRFDKHHGFPSSFGRCDGKQSYIAASAVDTSHSPREEDGTVVIWWCYLDPTCMVWRRTRCIVFEYSKGKDEETCPEVLFGDDFESFEDDETSLNAHASIPTSQVTHSAAAPTMMTASWILPRPDNNPDLLTGRRLEILTRFMREAARQETQELERAARTTNVPSSIHLLHPRYVMPTIPPNVAISGSDMAVNNDASTAQNLQHSLMAPESTPKKRLHEESLNTPGLTKRQRFGNSSYT